MKRCLAVVAFIVFLACSVTHAEETLFGGNVTHGWFFGRRGNSPL